MKLHRSALDVDYPRPLTLPLTPLPPYIEASPPSQVSQLPTLTPPLSHLSLALSQSPLHPSPLLEAPPSIRPPSHTHLFQPVLAPPSHSLSRSTLTPPPHTTLPPFKGYTTHALRSSSSATISLLSLVSPLSPPHSPLSHHPPPHRTHSAHQTS